METIIPGAHLRFSSHPHNDHMDSELKEKGPIRTKIVTITALLVPPAQGLIARGRSLSNASLRSLSNVSLRSLSGTPATSPTSTPNDPENLSPRSSIEVKRASFVDVMTTVSRYIAPHDILIASMTTRRLRHDLRTSDIFENWLGFNGWDTDALLRRAGEAKGKTAWKHLAKSAIQKATLLERYHALLDHKKSASKGKHHKKSIEKFMKILIDAVTEHETRNFRTLNALVGTLNMTFLHFVATIPADDWKIRYQKTFLMASYVNTQPLYPDIEQDVENVVKSIDFNEISTSPALHSAHDNFLYTYACFTWTDVPPLPLPSLNYDPPCYSFSSRLWSVPGLRQGAERYKSSVPMKGTYRKTNGDESKMTMKFELKADTKGLANKLSLPFTDKHIALTATVSDDGGNPPWEMEGSVNSETGRGTMKSQKGMVYDLRTTPWGIVGEKILGEKHLGYFVLQWA
ncbi:hypothetical protein BU17DRAFT_92628 [Hysterangium stoloniferum]|nr:hypothetical protein BU17DRAFT_92628 [Hysterangium stoloniferum]